MPSRAVTRAARWFAHRARAAGVLPPAPSVAELLGEMALHPRWPPGRAHAELDALLARDRAAQLALVASFEEHEEALLRIPVDAGDAGTGPAWRNGYFPALDTVCLYGLLARRRPRLVVEIGSGWSTRVARRAATDHGLDTRLVSIDPEPRVEVDELCDEVVRQRFEDCVDRVTALSPGDVLFVDSSHRVLMGNDVTVLFLEVLPRLAPGVLVHVHDVFLPWDYPAEWADRLYAEQYLLGTLLLAAGRDIDVVLPNFALTWDEQRPPFLARWWQSLGLTGADTHGVSFWFERRAPSGGSSEE